MIGTVSTEELLDLKAENKCKIIDVRTADAYNGWQLNGEPREGHIRGARSLPAKWLNYIDWIEIVRHKEILFEDTVIIYGAVEEEVQAAANRFKQAGYSSVFMYQNFQDDWCMNPELPMEKLSRYRHLVPAEWVDSLLKGNQPLHYNNNQFVVVHAHYRNRDAYLSGHIPGAIDMDTLALEAPETWNRRSPDELKQALVGHGISADTTVILYGKHMYPDNKDPFPGSAAGDIGAIRLALIMMYAGVKDVRVINGGFQSWIDAGFEISKADVPKKAIKDFGRTIPAHPELIVDTPKAKEMIVAGDSELVCVRSWPEYIGEVSGYNYIQAKGRIPGAVFVDCGSDAYHMENYRNVDHTVREYNETAGIWADNGITPYKHLAFYCGTGWRGSEAWFNAWLMGWPRVSVYDGGWFEWSNDSNNPYETGIPAEKAAIDGSQHPVD